MTTKVYVTGVGMTKFERPGRPAEHDSGWDYPDMVREAGSAALQDAGIKYEAIEAAAASYVYGDSCSGQRAIYELGETGIPIFNVNNNCASGSTALNLGYELLKGGRTDTFLAVGFEKMSPGSISEQWNDRATPLARHLKSAYVHATSEGAPIALEQFGIAGREHMERYGTTLEQFAKVAVKNHRHSVSNTRAQFRDEYTLAEVLESPTVFEPLTKLQCSPTSDGGAAAVLMTEQAVRRHGLQDQAVEVLAQSMVTDQPSSFNGRSAIASVGFDMTQQASRTVYEAAGIGPDEVDVIELHDCFSINEIVSYEALELCVPGKGGTLIDEGATTFGGRWVVNPSGGLISKGHPLGATGLAQCAELTWQLRGVAAERQVVGAHVGLQHNIGIGGAAVVTLYAGPGSANRRREGE